MQTLMGITACLCGHRVLLHDDEPTPCARCGATLAPDGTVLTPATKLYAATYIRTLYGGGLDRRLWRLTQPAAVGDLLFSYAVTASEAENATVVFASDADGDVLDLTPLPGSFVGDADHSYALNGLLSYLNH